MQCANGYERSPCQMPAQASGVPVVISFFIALVHFLVRHFS